VHVDGRPVLSCLTLAATVRRGDHGRGAVTGDELHPVQQAFIDPDALQCGFCTPGQLMSAVRRSTRASRTSGSSCRQHLPLLGLPEHHRGDRAGEAADATVELTAPTTVDAALASRGSFLAGGTTLVDLMKLTS